MTAVPSERYRNCLTIFQHPHTEQVSYSIVLWFVCNRSIGVVCCIDIGAFFIFDVIEIRRKKTFGKKKKCDRIVDCMMQNVYCCVPLTIFRYFVVSA